MNLVVPTVGVDPGPDWATNLNSSLTLIDQHNHSSGSGVPITPAGLSISSDLTFLSNNATNLRSVRLQPQASPLAQPADLGCLYEVGVDLYYNDGSGNQVRLTQSGSVAGVSGSISNLTAPASASYVSGNQTFVWQSAANTPANMDFGFAIFRNNVANSKGLSLFPPNAMTSDYSLILPNLPSVTNIMTLDPSGNMGASLNVDNSTLQIASNQIQVKSQGITQGLLAPRSTGTTVAAGGVAISGDCGVFTTSTIAPSFDNITNLQVTITTTGRPIYIGTQSSNQTYPNASMQFANTNGTSNILRLLNGVTQVALYQKDQSMGIPLPAMLAIDIQPAGTYTYTLQLANNNGNVSTVQYYQLVAYEL